MDEKILLFHQIFVSDDLGQVWNKMTDEKTMIRETYAEKSADAVATC